MTTLENKEPVSSTVKISQQLEDALLLAASSVGKDKPIGVAQLLSEFLDGDGIAKRAITIVGHGDRSTPENYSISDLKSELYTSQGTDSLSKQAITITISDKHVPITQQLLSMLNEARRLAVGELCVDTGHLLLADLQSIDSVMKPVIERVTKTNISSGEVLTSFMQLTRKRGSYVREKIAEHPITAESLPDVSRVIDLLDQAKSGTYVDGFINSQWTLALIQSIVSSRISVIMTEYEDEVSLALKGLALELSSHQSQLINIPRIIAPDATSLVEDPEGTIVEAVQKANGGVLVLPGEAKYLNHKAVRVALSKGNIRLVSYADEKVWSQLSKNVEGLKAHEVFLSTPNRDTIQSMLTAQKKTLEAGYSVMTDGDKPFTISIQEDALEAAVSLGYQYASLMGLPAILASKHLLDTAAINIKLLHSGMNRSSALPIDNSIDMNDVYAALKTITGIEQEVDNPERYLHMEEALGKEIIGQPEAIEAVSQVVRKSKTSLKDPNRPIGVFGFFGPSGVGKTELARALGRFMFHDDEAVIEIDMSEYMEKSSVSRLTGAPPGYVGYEDGGQLTEKVRKKPYCIVVFDEIEKAHEDVWNIMLQIMEKRSLTDSKGRTIDFQNAVIIMTGNVGSEYYAQLEAIGKEEVHKDVQKAIEATFRPEFLNRMDRILIFNALGKDDMKGIVDLRLADVNKRLEKGSKLHLEVTAEAHAFLERVGYDARYGARPMRRMVGKHIENPLGDKLLAKEFTAGDTIVADLEGESIVFRKSIQ